MMDLKRIMVVEDEVVIARDIQVMLDNLGYDASTVTSYGEEAIRKAGEIRPDLVLMDIVLSGAMNGIDAAWEIRRQFNIPVVYLTAYADNQTLERAKLTEPFGYILKPFEERELHTTIEMAFYKHEMEERLRKERDRAQMYLDMAGTIIAVVDEEGRIRLINRKGCEIFEHHEEDILGRNWLDLISPAGGNGDMRGLFDKLMSGRKGDHEYIEADIVTGSGRNRRIAWYNTPVKDRDNTVTGVICSGADITEQKCAEDALRLSEEKYRSIIENIEEGYYEIDRDGILTFFNDKLSKILGYSHEELTGMHCRRFMNEESADSSADILNEIFPEEIDEKTLGWKFMRPDGTARHLEASITPISNGNQEPGGCRGILRDITERKRGEEKLRQSYQQLQLTLEGAVKALASVIEMRDSYTAGHQRRVADLASAIAEEMNIPDRVIRGIHMAALVHDIGKIIVPAEILTKPSQLTATEFSLIKTHSQVGYDVLKEIDFPWPVADIVLQHHERIDGSGYPKGLYLKDIIVEARILAVADVVEAIASHRPYRPALGIETALDEIARYRGIIYDAAVVDACLLLFNEKGYTLDEGDLPFRAGSVRLGS